MERNILIGNGINIQFGGYDNYSNQAIMKRLIKNIEIGRYKNIFKEVTSAEIIKVINILFNILCNIEKYNTHNNQFFLKSIEVNRVKNTYTTNTPIEEIGLEDFLLALERYCDYYEDDEIFKDKVQYALRIFILDAIYNDGNVNKIDYPDGIANLLSRYKNVLTVNYDVNLDRLCNNVKHLHGQYNILPMQSFNLILEFVSKYRNNDYSEFIDEGLEYLLNNNAILSWFWLDKFGHMNECKEAYGIKIFETIGGRLDIVGLCPNNDYHLITLINRSPLKSINYFYYDEMDKQNAIDFINKEIKKSTTLTNVKNFWGLIR